MPAEAQLTDALDDRAGLTFVRGSGLRTIAYAGAVAASVAAIPIVARHLHAVGYGRLVTVTSLLLIVAALTEGGVANLGVREMSSGRHATQRQFMRELIGLRLALSVLGGVAAVAFSLAAGYPTVIVEGTAIASIGLVLANLQVTLAVPLVAHLRLPWLALLDFAGPAATSATLIALVLARAGLLAFFAAALVGYTLTLAITALLVHPEISLRPSFGPHAWRSLLGQSAVFAAATALGAIYFQVVMVAMSLLTNAHQVGVFSLAFRVISVVNGVPLLVVGSAFPILLRAARDDHARLRYALGRLLEGSLILGGLISLLAVVGAPFVAHVLGGGEYPGSATVLVIVGCGVLATWIAVVFAFAMLSLGRYRQLIAINAVMVVFAVALCAVLVPSDGARGAAFVTLTLEVLLAVSYVMAVTVGSPGLRPSLPLAPRIVAALACGFAVGLGVPLPALPAALAGSAAFAVAIVLLRAVPLELISAFGTRSAGVGP